MLSGFALRVNSLILEDYISLLMFNGLFRIEEHSACGVNQQISMVVACDGTGKTYANPGKLASGNCTRVHRLTDFMCYPREAPYTQCFLFSLPL